jgi:hypothetical protein
MGLSSKGLERGGSTCEKDFSFIGKSFEYECTKFEACFISPRIHSLLLQDRTVDSFVIEWEPDGIDHQNVFESLMQLAKGRPITLSATDAASFLGLAKVLGNTELMEVVLSHENPMTLSTACSRLTMKSSFGGSFDDEIAFIAAHFGDIDTESLRKLNVPLLEQIVSSPLLRVRDEDWLLEFICTLDCDHTILLRYLLCEYLSVEGISVLLAHFSPSDLDPLIWDSIIHRLLIPVQSLLLPDNTRFTSDSIAFPDWAPPSQQMPGPVECPMTTPKSLHGVIAFLTAKHGGNVNLLGTVRITSKSAFSDAPEDALSNVADLTSDTAFWSGLDMDQWVCWDFQGIRCHPTHYTISACYLKSWVVESSLDGAEWTEIDRQTDNREFADWNTASFPMSNVVEARFIRLTQTSANHYGHGYLRLRAFEIFGTFREADLIELEAFRDAVNSIF